MYESNAKNSILRVIFAYGNENIFEIKQKSNCTTVNWQKSTKFNLH